MIEIQKQFLDKAIHQLRVLGCKYAIQLPNGEIIGNLELKPIEPVKKKRPRNSYKHLGFKDKLIDVIVGDVVLFDPPEGMSLGQLQGLVTGLAGHAWGKGSYTSTQCKGQLQIMRIA